jgi:hypothetical protein
VPTSSKRQHLTRPRWRVLVALVVASAGGFALALRNHGITSQTQRLIAGFGLVAVGIFGLVQLATTDVHPPKSRELRVGGALRYAGFVVFGASQLVPPSWFSVVVNCVAILLMLSPLAFKLKTTPQSDH